MPAVAATEGPPWTISRAAVATFQALRAAAPSPSRPPVARGAPPPCGIDEEPQALLGCGLCRNRYTSPLVTCALSGGLLGGPSGDDEHEVRELRFQALGQLAEIGLRLPPYRARRRRSVGYEVACKVGFRADEDEVMFRRRDRAHGRARMRVAREHDQGDSRKSAPSPRAGALAAGTWSGSRPYGAVQWNV